MRIDILTLFPEMFYGVLGSSILKRASETVADPARPDDPSKARPPVVEYLLHDIRDYTQNKHGKVDKPSFGGGPGMVIQCQPVWDAVQAVEGQEPQDKPTRVLLTPKGQRLTQDLVEWLSTRDRLLLISGHYEGFDQRVIDRLHEEPPQGAVKKKGTDPVSTAVCAESVFTDRPGQTAGQSASEADPSDGLLEVSIGDYVLTGGELPAMVLIDAIVRLIPGALGDDTSAQHESFSTKAGGQLDYPHYTRPQTWAGRDVPLILLSGDHAKITDWRESQRRASQGPEHGRRN